MKRDGKIEICALIGLLFTTGAVANMAGRPYDGIMGRNVFDLRPPSPRQLVNPDPVRPLPPGVTLTGITTILRIKFAFLTIPAAKPGALPESMMLAEGQAQNGVEVRQIDEKAGIVRVINHGEPQILDFDFEGAKSSGPSFPPHVIPPPGNGVPPLGNLPPMSSLSPEEQVALIEVQRVKYQQENNPLGKIVPPTELTSEANVRGPH